MCAQFSGTDGHAVCCYPDDVRSVEWSIHQPSNETYGEVGKLFRSGGLFSLKFAEFDKCINCVLTLAVGIKILSM